MGEQTVEQIEDNCPECHHPSRRNQREKGRASRMTDRRANVGSQTLPSPEPVPAFAFTYSNEETGGS